MVSFVLYLSITCLFINVGVRKCHFGTLITYIHARSTISKFRHEEDTVARSCQSRNQHTTKVLSKIGGISVGFVVVVDLVCMQYTNPTWLSGVSGDIRGGTACTNQTFQPHQPTKTTHYTCFSLLCTWI